MTSKEEIVANWLPRYTDTPLENFGQYILLTNFDDYLHLFSTWFNTPINGQDKPMPNVTADGITDSHRSAGGNRVEARRRHPAFVRPEMVLDAKAVVEAEFIAQLEFAP